MDAIKQDWYCPKCEMYVSSESVTFIETHELCNRRVIIKDVKQETLEEVAERLCPNSSWKHGFIAGSKRQVERIPIDIEQKWLEYRDYTNNEDAWCFKEWLVEQFKKK